MWVYEREGASGDVFVTLRVPSDLWAQWEYRHRHFGAAIRALRLTVIDLLANHAMARSSWKDRPDPFYRDSP